MLPSLGQAHLLVSELKWAKGQEIKILFLNGGQEEKILFKRAVSLWSPYLHLQFQFAELSKKNSFLPSEYKRDTIRVSFNRQEGVSYSSLGKAYNKSSSKYMNIAIDPKLRLTFLKTVLHEFGHSLALLHEHQHPDITSTRSDEEISSICQYLFLIDKNDETRFRQCLSNVRGNTRAEFEANGIEIGDYDPQSIMGYDLGEKSVKGFYDLSLSLKDKVFMASQYPFDEPLTQDEIRQMDQKDHEEEKEWLLENYQHPSCRLVQENQSFYLIKTKGEKIIKVHLSSLSLLDRYYEICTKTK